MQDETQSNAFGPLLQEYRLRAGLTQEALAERAGLGRRSIQGLERGENVPHRGTLQRLIQALALSPDEGSKLAEAAKPSRRRRALPQTAASRESFSVARKAEHRHHNLPAQVTSFIGRAQEIAEVKRLLQTTRLLTLTGTGGCGKTRLALQVATDVLDAYPDGVWLADLAPVTDPEFVPMAVATALGIREGAGQPIRASVVSFLRSQRLLLILDNCEHLLDASTDLAGSILRGCPDVRILATSRTALGIGGEGRWRVPSLATPSPEPLPSAECLARSEAVRLFVERARAVRPTFEMTDENAAAVAQICVRLDGIPLALELAAARLGGLTVGQIAARLDQRFLLLTEGNRVALPRQQTLHATLDWSFALLNPPERRTLACLSTFVGGWTLEAAEVVCTREGASAFEVVDALLRLVDQSLVVAEERAGTMRYRLQETVRLYAQEQLDLLGETEDVRRRHRNWCLALADEAALQIIGPHQRDWLDRLETEHDNLRSALVWSLAEPDNAAASLHLALTLWWFWWSMGHVGEGRVWLARALSSGGQVAPPDRARALVVVGHLAWGQGDLAEAAVFLQEGLRLCRVLADYWGASWALMVLAMVALRRNDLGTVRALLDESAAVAREGNEPRALAFALFSQGMEAQERHDYRHAQTCYEESLRLFRAVGDPARVAMALWGLGTLEASRRHYDAARAHLEEACELYREAGDVGGIPQVLSNLGMVVLELGDPMTARAYLEESVTLYRRQGNRSSLAVTLSRLGQLLRDQGAYGQARAVVEEALTIARDTGATRSLALFSFSLGTIAHLQGDIDIARAAYREGLTLLHELGDTASIADCLVVLAKQAARVGHRIHAVKILGTAVMARGRAPEGYGMDDPSLEPIRAWLADPTMAVAVEGQAMTLEQAVAYAMEEDGG